MELLSVKETALFFGQTEAVIKGWLQHGLLPKAEISIKIGRRRMFIKEKLEEFVLKQIPTSPKLF